LETDSLTVELTPLKPFVILQIRNFVISNLNYKLPDYQITKAQFPNAPLCVL
jgi:hypothetical protein